MTEKRYFERKWEGEYYIFDSQTISEKEFDEKVQYEDYRAFEDCMYGDDVINRMNELNDENQHIKNTIKEMLDNERTEIGKSVLKQLWEVIQ